MGAVTVGTLGVGLLARSLTASGRQKNAEIFSNVKTGTQKGLDFLTGLYDEGKVVDIIKSRKKILPFKEKTDISSFVTNTTTIGDVQSQKIRNERQKVAQGRKLVEEIRSNSLISGIGLPALKPDASLQILKTQLYPKSSAYRNPLAFRPLPSPPIPFNAPIDLTHSFGYNIPSQKGSFSPINILPENVNAAFKLSAQKGGINTSFGRRRNSAFISTQALKAGGALLGTAALSIGGGIAGSVLGDKLIGDQYGIGSLLGGTLGSSLGGAALLKGGALFAGGQTAAGALAASPLAGAVAIGATAYGGYKAGNALYRRANSKDFEGISEGTSEAYLNTSKLVSKSINAGKSSEDIKRIIDAQISSTQGQIRDAKSGLGNFGLGKETNDLSRAVEELKQLRESIDAQKEQIDSAKKSEEFQAKMLTALEKIAAGGGGDNKATISVEISLKDADKLPDIFDSKIIKPLEEQLRGLQNRLTNTEQRVGVNPSPASA